jgi:excisionase family DNA binding protein
MTTTEAAQLLFLSKGHLMHLIRKGEIQAVRLRGKGRPWDVDEDSVRKWKASSTDSERKARVGKKSPWQHGLLLNPTKQWRCSHCYQVQPKDDRTKCLRCGGVRDGSG